MPSSRRSFLFQWSPPVNPPSPPSEATTRWHGITIDVGFFPSAWPTARCAFGRPIAFAICPYVATFPKGIARVAL